MGTWHPASGKWGFFETAGSKEAKKSRAEIDKMLESLGSRKGEVSEYYGAIGQMQGQKEKRDYLSGLEKFIGESYTIESESGKRVGRTGLKSVYDENAELEKERVFKERKRFEEESLYTSDMRRLNLGQKEMSDIYGIEDLIRQLQLEKQNY